MSFNIGLVSLGCAKNQTDAETMLGILNSDGYNIVFDAEEADAIIVNTCGFIESAKQESINTLLEMAQYKDGRCKLLIASGCLAERYSEEIARDIPEVDAIIGTGDYDKIAEAIKIAAEGEMPVICGNPNRDPDEGLPRILSTPSYTAYLKIAEGCSNNCTYCAIPMIRGRFRSRKPEAISDEAKRLAQSGVKELIIIAQDTTRYGTDIDGKPSLAGLLEKLVEVEGIEWIRVHYFYPEAVTDELIETMAKYEKICPYIDMPIQHISNEILRRMARRTNRMEIESKIKKLRERIPDCVIRTSIIVGFPGETEEQFNELYDFVNEIRFDRMGVFAYSQEEGTPAAEFNDQVDEGIKQERLDALMTLQQGISLELNRAKIGSTLEVIAEGYDEENFLFYGRSRGDSIDVDGKVYFGTENEIFPGDIIKVKILDADEYDLTGQAID